MKQGKNPTRRQKGLITSHGLNPANWLVERETPVQLVLINRETKKTRRILYCYERSDRKIANQ